MVRIPRSHRGGRGSIPRLGRLLFPFLVDMVLATRKIKTQVFPRNENERKLFVNKLDALVRKKKSIDKT